MNSLKKSGLIEVVKNRFAMSIGKPDINILIFFSSLFVLSCVLVVMLIIPWCLNSFPIFFTGYVRALTTILANNRWGILLSVVDGYLYNKRGFRFSIYFYLYKLCATNQLKNTWSLRLKVLQILLSCLLNRKPGH